MNIGNRRAPFINYRKPGIFMITMNKFPGLPSWSDIVCQREGCNPLVVAIPKGVGKIIQNHLFQFKKLCPNSQIFKLVVMPDHIHFIVYVKQKLEEELGIYLARFKREVIQEAKDLNLVSMECKSLFETGFNDQFLKHNRSLQVLKDYITANPSRLWERIKNPDYFSRSVAVDIAGKACNLFGNLSLLKNPFKEAVVIHRNFSQQELENKIELWRYTLYNAGVLVGAFISKAEKAIFEEALAFGGKVVLISTKSYDNREKPYKKLFDHCKTGNLLIVSPIVVKGKEIPSRQECLLMNELAERITEN